MLNYGSHSQKSYETFVDRLTQQRPHKDDFGSHQISQLDWLEENEYLRFGDDGAVEISNMRKVILLGEIFRNGCLCYDAYKGTWKDTLDMMINEGTLRVGSSLFSELEAKYIDYHLNKRSFINSLDLRNRYAHGSHFGADKNKHEHAGLFHSKNALERF